MSTSIHEIKDKQGNQALPITHERAVKDSNGTTLETKLQTINSDIDTIESTALFIDGSGTSASVPEFDAKSQTVQITPQSLSPQQKQQARTNIGVYSTAEVDNKIEALDGTAQGTSSDNHITVSVTETNGIITGVNCSTSDIAPQSNTYTKAEVRGMVTTPSQGYATYVATSATTAVTQVLPATGAADTIYRVSCWDGSANSGAGAYNVAVYSEYTWDDVSNPHKYVFLCVKSQIGEVFDISAYHNNETYVNLAAALDSNNGGGVPQSLQKGGMSVKFVQSSDNKYVQFRLMATSFSTDESDWQSENVDDEPTVGSENLVKSKSVAELMQDVFPIVRTSTQTFTATGNKYYFSNLKIKAGQLYSIKVYIPDGSTAEIDSFSIYTNSGWSGADKHVGLITDTTYFFIAEANITDIRLLIADQTTVSVGAIAMDLVNPNLIYDYALFVSRNSNGGYDINKINTLVARVPKFNEVFIVPQENSHTFSSGGNFRYFENLNIKQGQAFSIKLESEDAVWTDCGIFTNSGWNSYDTHKNLLNGVEYNFIAEKDITYINVITLSVSTYGTIKATLITDSIERHINDLSTRLLIEEKAMSEMPQPINRNKIANLAQTYDTSLTTSVQDRKITIHLDGTYGAFQSQLIPCENKEYVECKVKLNVVGEGFSKVSLYCLLYGNGSSSSTSYDYDDLESENGSLSVMLEIPQEYRNINSHAKFQIRIIGEDAQASFDVELLDYALFYLNSISKSEDYGYNMVQYSEYALNSNLTPTIQDRKWCLIGDSLTGQGTYIEPTISFLGLSENYTKISKGGKKMSGSSVDNPAMWEDSIINQIPNDCWLITLMGGTNDWASSIGLGTNDSVNTSTYKGALNVAITKIVSAHPTARLIVMGQPYGELPERVTQGVWNNAYTNELGLTPYDYAKAAGEVCRLRGIPFVNMAELTGWNHQNITTFIKDDGGLLHPLPVGGERIASVLCGFVKSIMPTNGTSY